MFRKSFGRSVYACYLACTQSRFVLFTQRCSPLTASITSCFNTLKLHQELPTNAQTNEQSVQHDMAGRLRWDFKCVCSPFGSPSLQEEAMKTTTAAEAPPWTVTDLGSLWTPLRTRFLVWAPMKTLTLSTGSERRAKIETDTERYNSQTVDFMISSKTRSEGLA